MRKMLTEDEIKELIEQYIPEPDVHYYRHKVFITYENYTGYLIYVSSEDTPIDRSTIHYFDHKLVSAQIQKNDDMLTIVDTTVEDTVLVLYDHSGIEESILLPNAIISDTFITEL